MNPFLENSGPILLVGIVLEVLLASALVRTGRGVLLWFMVGVLLCTFAGVLIERFVATPKEQVAATLYGAARAIEHNDVDGLFEHISSTAWYTPERARNVLQQYQVQQARIIQLEIEINELTSPPSATAKVVGLFTVEDVPAHQVYSGRVLLTVQLRRENDRWRITGHQEGEYSQDW